MSAIIKPFPLARRRALIAGLAAQMAARPMAAAEKHLQLELRRHARILQRRSIAPKIIERETRSLEAAVRGALWRAILLPQQPPNGAA
jgi:hypothetical protein